MNNGFKTVLSRLTIGAYFKFKNGKRMYRCGAFVGRSTKRCYYDAKTSAAYFKFDADVVDVIYFNI